MTPAEILAGRKRHAPERVSFPYAKLLNLGGYTTQDRRPLIKPTQSSLRQFGRMPYSRRAINRIKDPIAQLKWEIGPKPEIKINSTLQKQIDICTQCFEKPNYDDSFRSFVESIIEDALVGGALCYEHEVGGDGARPLWLWPVDVLSIQINARWAGKDSEPRYYQQLGFGNVGGVQGVPLLNSELVYGRVNPSSDNPFGVGELEVAFNSINRKLGVSNYAGNLASNAQPENLLSMPGISSDELDTMRSWWRNEVEGMGQTPFVSLPIGAEADVLKLRGTDDASLFLGYQELLVREIATAFNIDAMSLNVSKDVNRSTAEVVDDADWENAVVPKATLVSAYITRETIEAKMGFSQLEFRFLGLSRDDKEAEANIYKTEYEGNATTPNEYRARNSKEPLDSPWANLTYADVEIAMQAARGSAVVDDPKLKTANGKTGKSNK